MLVQVIVFGPEYHHYVNVGQFCILRRLSNRRAQQLVCRMVQYRLCNRTCKSDLSAQHVTVSIAPIRHQRRVDRQCTKSSRVLDANIHGRGRLCRSRAGAQICGVWILEGRLQSSEILGKEKNSPQSYGTFRSLCPSIVMESASSIPSTPALRKAYSGVAGSTRANGPRAPSTWSYALYLSHRPRTRRIS